MNFGYYTINIWYQYFFVLQRDELFRAENRTISYENSVLIYVSLHFVFGTILCTNHWTEAGKFFPAERPACSCTIILWGTTALIWLYKWRDYYLLSKPVPLLDKLEQTVKMSWMHVCRQGRKKATCKQAPLQICVRTVRWG